MKKAGKIIGCAFLCVVAAIIMALLIIVLIILQSRTPSKAVISEMKSEFGNVKTFIDENESELLLLTEIQRRMVQYNSTNSDGYSVARLTLSHEQQPKTLSIKGDYYDSSLNSINESDISVDWVSLEESATLALLLSKTDMNWFVLSDGTIKLYLVEGKENTLISVEKPLIIESSKRHDVYRCDYYEEYNGWWIALLVLASYN